MQNPFSRSKCLPLIRLLDWILRYTLFHGFDTLGSHLREEGSLDYDGGLVCLQVQTNFDTIINRQQPPPAPRQPGGQLRRGCVTPHASALFAWRRLQAASTRSQRHITAPPTPNVGHASMRSWPTSTGSSGRTLSPATGSPLRCRPCSWSDAGATP
jgi:hypothetical protein